MAKTGAALIGYTGFVGSNLARQMAFQGLFRSTNIETMAGRHFDLVVCAGVSAVKWLANREPDRDRAGIERLIGSLRAVSAERFVLVSTVDVYPDTCCVDEASVILRHALQPYGRHRLDLEVFVRKRFPHALILRLPGLFGPGLKKNIIYDLIHNNRLANINPASSFQWYPLERLSRDIVTALSLGLDIVNLAPEPIPTSRLLGHVPSRVVGEVADPEVSYDVHTRHAAQFGGQGHYVMTADQVMVPLADFLSVTHND